MRLLQLRGVQGVEGPKGTGQENRGVGCWCLFRGIFGEGVLVRSMYFVLVGFFLKHESINEREGAGRGRRREGQERHGSKAALLGAGEASEEVTMTVVLSRFQGRGGVGEVHTAVNEGGHKPKKKGRGDGRGLLSYLSSLSGVVKCGLNI